MNAAVLESPAVTPVDAPSGLPASVKRARRAVAARHLLALQADDALDAPDRWDWDTLGDLPSWCLLGEEERRRLQCVAGLVFLGPELCRIVDGRVLRAIGETVEAELLAQVLDDADTRFPDAVDEAAVEEEAPERSDDSPAGMLDGSAEEIGARLHGLGAGVLCASLGERLEAVLPLDTLKRSLGEPLGTLDGPTAQRVLSTAEALLLSSMERAR